ncbi:glutamate formimidoyltransferase [Granulicella sp. L60]|uniref:glutamate formimidoyltransferase n=1 Tax=Granulicella sp. L60 TaxID=1641866 RepID=UPI00131BD683|nr:glutamate formimidoyltransferase [Granulicella sp. L60]
MNPEAIIECVPNFSEGTDEARVRQIVAATQVDGVRLLDWSLDTAHNRSVITLAGSPEGIVEAAVRAAGKAAQLIDLTTQNGVHPRIGAADVIPFIPVSGASLAECAVLARQAGLLIWRRYGVPVYFYGAAAARPDRILLEDVRRGQFEGLRDASRRDAARRPDIGGPDLHPTAGASAVGARSFLIAYNIHLQQPDIAAARAIARDIRAANGGLHGVKAIGVLANGRAQVSMNVTDFRITPMHHVYATVHHLAQRHGVLIQDAELIGLIPQAAYEEGAEWVRQITGFDPDDKVLERKLDSPIAWP